MTGNKYIASKREGKGGRYGREKTMLWASVNHEIKTYLCCSLYQSWRAWKGHTSSLTWNNSENSQDYTSTQFHTCVASKNMHWNMYLLHTSVILSWFIAVTLHSEDEHLAHILATSVLSYQFFLLEIFERFLSPWRPAFHSACLFGHSEQQEPHSIFNKVTHHVIRLRIIQPVGWGW